MLLAHPIFVDEQGWRTFQWAPTLGGECYQLYRITKRKITHSFNGHPPLGVNATEMLLTVVFATIDEFQWAPTLGGECYDYEDRKSVG